ncbi:hypothetical protein D4764_11G0007770 [Takifugu flavidus]|uniref:Uncharacterized protein n=1 Tax=Takifugu flavidus TaxID=433684 RepID=A0A5C6PID6_9TELE|nr:hypothetical protein D4764_11G0007770 [Takifugu flavidus]
MDGRRGEACGSQVPPARDCSRTRSLLESCSAAASSRTPRTRRASPAAAAPQLRSQREVPPPSPRCVRSIGPRAPLTETSARISSACAEHARSTGAGSRAAGLTRTKSGGIPS